MTWQQPIVLTFDGLDGVGKSSVAKAVTRRLRQRRLAVRYVHSPAAPYRMLKSAVEASQQVRERYYYYLACNYNLSEQIRADQSNMITVVDRYVYSTYAYHVVHDPSLQWEGFSSGLIEPAIAFHVTCRPEIQISRLKRRDGDIADEEALLCTWRSLGEAFATLPLVQIDNGASTVREAVSEVMHRLEPRMG